jgi:hypothetical protein
MFKKNHDPSCLINQKSSEPPLSISNFFLTPPITFLPPPLDINNDRSLSDPRKIGLSIFNFNFSHCGFYVLGNNHFLIWGVGVLGFFWKKYFNALADRKKLFRFCIVAEKKFMLSPARKKNIALLNLSSQYCFYGKMYFCST